MKIYWLILSISVAFLIFYNEVEAGMIPRVDIFKSASLFDVTFLKMELGFGRDINEKLIISKKLDETENENTNYEETVEVKTPEEIQDVLEVLKEQKYILNMTPLMIAIATTINSSQKKQSKRKLNMINFILHKCPDVNYQDSLGNTALHYAVLLSTVTDQADTQIRIIKKLIQSSDVALEIRNNDNQTPMDIARRYNLKEIGKMLLSPIAKQRARNIVTAIVESKLAQDLPGEIVDYIYSFTN